MRKLKFIVVFALFVPSLSFGFECNRNFVYNVLANDFNIQQIERESGKVIYTAEIKMLDIAHGNISFKYTWDKGNGVSGILVFGSTSEERFYTFNSWGVGRNSESSVTYFNLEPVTCSLISEGAQDKDSRTIIELIAPNEYKIYSQSLVGKNQWVNDESFQKYIKTQSN